MTKIKIARIVTASLASVVVVSGVVGKINYEGICALSLAAIWAACPLGYLERSLASRELLPQWTAVALVVISVILLGRVFCAWICPSVLLRRVFGSNGKSNGSQQAAPKGGKWAAYSPYAVLAGVLLASFLFRFPVFCLFCPIGLFFGFLYAAIRVVSPDPFGLELLVFPLMLGLELWGLKSWCRSICPLGALLSIISGLNRFLLPVLSTDKCLASKGVNCQACQRACPEGINLIDSSKSLTPNSCTKCLECYDKCPTKAIKIAMFK